MIGVLIKNGSTVVEKRGYGGDTSNVPQVISDFQAKNPSFIVEIHQDTDPDWKVAFEQVAVVPLQTGNQAGWQAAKAAGAPQALLFIAKFLGLE